ncbi:MAG: S8 family serine peptidase [Acidimicrobiia bacterium]
MLSPRLYTAATALATFVGAVMWVTLAPSAPSDGAVASEMFLDEVPASEGSEMIPYDDGFNHFVVRVDPSVLPSFRAAASEGSSGEADERLRIDLERYESGEDITPADLREMDPALAQALIEQGLLPADDLVETSAVDSGEVVSYLADLPGVASVEYLGADMAVVLVDETISMEDVDDLPGVEALMEDMLFPTASAATDELFDAAWHLHSEGQVSGGQTFVRDIDVDAPEAWDTAKGDGVVIAVIDGGFTTDLPELVPNLWSPPGEVCGNGIDDDGNGYVDDCGGWDFARNQPLRPFDGTSTMYSATAHGVSVASIAAAPDNNGGVVGVAPDSKLMLLGASVTGTGNIGSAAISAVRYAIANGADAINMSFGATMTDFTYPLNEAYWAPVLNEAAAAGVVVVAAAGNYQTSSPVTPATFVAQRPNGLSVAASTFTDKRASFSSYGDTVALFAPGASVVTNYPNNYPKRANGTSYASPITVGAVAVLASAYPNASAADLVTAIKEGADRVPALASYVPEGRRLNIDRSLDYLAGAQLSNFTFTNLTGLPSTARVAVEAPAGDQVSFTLATMVDDQVMSVPDRQIAWNGQTATTDASGTVTFAADVVSGVESDFAIPDLPDGAYGVAAQVKSAGSPVDVPVLSVFTIGVPTPVTSSTTVAAEAPSTSAPIATSTTLPAAPSSTMLPPDTAPTTTTIAATTTTNPPGTPATLPSAPTTTTTAPSGGGGGGPGSGGSSNEPASTTTTTTASSSTTAQPDRGSAGTSPTTTTTTPPVNPPAPPATTTTTIRQTTTTTAGSPPETVPPGPGTVSTPSPSGIRVTSVSPSAVPTSGGTVVVRGENFPEYPIVSVGGSPATVTQRLTSQQLVVAVRQSGPGWTSISVHPIADSSDIATLTNAFQYVDAPTGPNVPSTTTTTTTTTAPGGSGGGSTGGGAGTTSTTTIPVTTSTTLASGGGQGGGATSTSSTSTTSTTSTTVASSTTTIPATPTISGSLRVAPPSTAWNITPSVQTGSAPSSLAGVDQSTWNSAFSTGGASTGVRLTP